MVDEWDARKGRVVVKFRGLLLGIVFAAIAVGFAAAMPGAMTVSNGGAEDSIEPTQSETPKPAGSKVKEAESGEVEGTDLDETSGPEDNHGAVVSIVAHCDVKGRWHGEAVRSIAENQDATAADAEAACEAAKAAAADAPSRGRSGEAKAKAQGEGKGRTEGAEASTGGPPDHAGPPADKGKKP